MEVTLHHIIIVINIKLGFLEMTRVYCDYQSYNPGTNAYNFNGISATLPRPPRHKVYTIYSSRLGIS